MYNVHLWAYNNPTWADILKSVNQNLVNILYAFEYSFIYYFYRILLKNWGNLWYKIKRIKKNLYTFDP